MPTLVISVSVCYAFGSYVHHVLSGFGCCRGVVSSQTNGNFKPDATTVGMMLLTTNCAQMSMCAVARASVRVSDSFTYYAGAEADQQ